MRQIIIPILLATALNGCVTPMEATETAVAQDVVGVSQADLYQRSRQWFAETFVSAEDVIDYGDASTGTIIGKAVATTGRDTLGLIKYGIRYTLRVDTKDGRMRVTTKIISYTNDDGKQQYDTEYGSAARQLQAETHIADLTAQLYAYVGEDKGDW